MPRRKVPSPWTGEGQDGGDASPVDKTKEMGNTGVICATRHSPAPSVIPAQERHPVLRYGAGNRKGGQGVTPTPAGKRADG